MFGRKKKQKDKSDQRLFSVGIVWIEDLTDEQYSDWSDELMDVADNVGSTSSIVHNEWDQEQLNILGERFLNVDQSKTFFMINEIDYEAINIEIKALEQKHKWKKFFNTIPLFDYIDAEDRAVFNAAKILLCTNDIAEAKAFLQEQATL
ncbi:hypothetical protein [Sporosarcina sp. OR05]|uniref:hypothetical protein n=1 Tax=Sporosarcina sp. OR05 TaxID=2969819 RepID=UPI003529FF66